MEGDAFIPEHYHTHRACGTCGLPEDERDITFKVMSHFRIPALRLYALDDPHKGVLPDPSLTVIEQPPLIPSLGDDAVASISLVKRLNEVVRGYQVDFSERLAKANLDKQAADIIKYVPPSSLIEDDKPVSTTCIVNSISHLSSSLPRPLGV